MINRQLTIIQLIKTDLHIINNINTLGRKMDPYGDTPYEQTKEQSKRLAMRMRSGTGVNRIIGGQDAETTHYMDALQRFQKDYASYDKHRREQQKQKRQQELQKKRLQYLERENKRWEVVEQHEQFQNSRMQRNMNDVIQGKKRTANSNGLAYNPINLTYDKNPQGQKLRLLDQDHKIRGYVRAYNMDHSGNSAYNPLNGSQRRGVDKIVPNELADRYMAKRHEFEENRQVKAPQTSNQRRRNIFQYY